MKSNGRQHDSILIHENIISKYMLNLPLTNLQKRNTCSKLIQSKTSIRQARLICKLSPKVRKLHIIKLLNAKVINSN